MAMIQTPESYESQLRSLLSKGWEVQSEGPTGAQLRAKKKMKLLDGIALCLGFLLVFIIPGLGIFFIALAMIDYLFLTKGQAAFLYRSDGRFEENA